MIGLHRVVRHSIFLKEVVMTALLDLFALVAAVALVTVAIAWIVRQVVNDGVGVRPAPRGTEDWSAFGLPSHPHGT